jgi:hyaluronoglucosaminidase
VLSFLRPAARVRAARSIALAALLTGSLAGAREADAAALPQPPFPLRIVKIVGRPGEPATQAHLEFSVAAGFNAVWVYGPQAGRWSPGAAPDGPVLEPAFVELARWCRERGVRLFVSVSPVGETGGTFVFSDPKGAARIRAFFTLLRRECGVRDFVLSFDDLPRELLELSDLLEYGRSTAPAHLDLARRVLRRQGRGSTYWLCGSAYSDWHLDDQDYSAYASRWLEGLPKLPSRIGVVWTGPDTISESISLEDLETTRRRLGGPRLLLYDNYPVNDDWRREALALVLGPLRRRDPRLHEAVAAYLACPMEELGASRLPLLTIADYLRDPGGYDPDESWRQAIVRLAGPDPVALDALRIQAAEWGGWVDSLNYHGEDAGPADLAAEVDDPGIMASWTYTLRRYEERMAALARVEDRAFRDDVLEAMRRRLAVARALPVVRSLRATPGASPVRAEEALRSLAAERARVASDLNALRALDRFLDAAGLLEDVKLVPGSVDEP